MNILITIILWLMGIGAFVCVGLPMIFVGIMMVIALILGIIGLFFCLVEEIQWKFRRKYR